MDEITRRLGGEEDTYKVYTKEEADERDIDYVYWKEAQPGDWAITDDDYVGQCYDSKEYTGNKGRTRPFKTFTFARKWVSDSSDLFYEARKEKEAWAYSAPTTWDEKEARTSRVDRMAEVMVQMMLSDQPIDWHKLGLAYRTDEKIPEATVKRLVKNKHIRKVIKEKLREELQDQDVNEADVISKFEEAYRVAKDKGQPNAMIRVAENYREMLDMSPDKEESTQELEYNISTEELLDDEERQEELNAKESRTSERAITEGDRPVEEDERGNKASAEVGER